MTRGPLRPRPLRDPRAPRPLKGPTARGQHETGDLGTSSRPQTLVQGAVLGVDGHDLGSGSRRAPWLRPRHPRSATPCSRAPAACPRRERTSVTPSPANPTTAFRTTSAPPSDPAIATSPSGPVRLGSLWQQAGRAQMLASRRRATTTSGRSSCAWAARSSTESMRTESDDLEPLAVGPHDIDGLSADRPGRADERDLSRPTCVAVYRIAGCVRPRLGVIPSAPIAPGSRSPATRTAARRSGRASHRGRAAAIPCPSSLRSRFTSDSQRSPTGPRPRPPRRATRPSGRSTDGCGR